jgi:excisionase family DNA binding protein
LDKLTYSVPEVAAMLGISRSAAYDCVHRGDIPTIVLGRRLVVSRTALARLLDAANPSIDESAVAR